MSFKMAGVLAFRNVAPKCRPILLEPIQDVEVWTPEANLGEVMGDLSSRRGQILGTEPGRAPDDGQGPRSRSRDVQVRDTATLHHPRSRYVPGTVFELPGGAA